MNILIFTLCLVFLSGFSGVLVSNYLWHKRKWKLTFNEEEKELVLEQESAAGKVEFLEDATREELEELNKPRLWKFLNQFKKK